MEAIFDDVIADDVGSYSTDDYYDNSTNNGWPVCSKPIYNGLTGVLDVSAVIYACTVNMPSPNMNPSFFSKYDKIDL